MPAHPLVLAALEDLRTVDGLWWNVTPHHVSRMTGGYLRSLGISSGAHALRHFAGTSWYRASGHDLLATAALLRHKDVTTTMVYAQLDPTRGSEVVDSVTLPGLGSTASDDAGAAPLRPVREEAG